MSNTIEKVKFIANEIINNLNKIKVSGDYLNGTWAVDTYLDNVMIDDDGNYEIALRTLDMKIGGPDDNDENDGRMEDELRDNFKKILKKSFPDLVIVGEMYGSKGSWYFRCEFKSEKSKNKKKNTLQSELKKYREELIDFNNSIHLRIQNQKSKKKTCANCDSNVNVSFFKSHKCPVCNCDMYTETDKKRVNNLKDRIKTRETKLKNLN